ncbi:MAG: putative membrane protein [Candidatus Endobugula sp.]|jgi:uncharacterized membrane protein
MPRVPLLVIALFFVAGGVAHFVLLDSFMLIMPGYLNYHRELVMLSGILEMLGGIGILVPQTRVWAGYGLIALMIAVYPANINMAFHPEQYGSIPEVILYLRLPLQLLFICFVGWAIAPERRGQKF